MAAAQLSEKILAPPAAPTAPISPPPSEQILLLTTRVSPQPQPSGEWRRHSTSTTGGASLEPSGQRPRTPKHDLPPHRYAGNRTDVFLVTAGTSEGRRVALVAEVKLCLDHAAMTYIRDSAPSNARHGRVTKDQDVENVGHDLLDQLAYSMRRTNARMGAITNGCDIVVVERDFDFDRSELKRTATKELQLSRYEEANRKRLQETVHERLLEEGHGSDHPQAGLPRRSRRMTEREEVSRSAGRRPCQRSGNHGRFRQRRHGRPTRSLRFSFGLGFRNGPPTRSFGFRLRVGFTFRPDASASRLLFEWLGVRSKAETLADALEGNVARGVEVPVPSGVLWQEVVFGGQPDQLPAETALLRRHLPRGKLATQMGKGQPRPRATSHRRARARHGRRKLTPPAPPRILRGPLGRCSGRPGSDQRRLTQGLGEQGSAHLDNAATSSARVC